MLHIIPEDSEEKKGTCIVCPGPITTGDYWRCLDAVCGAVEGNGRVCGDCYKEVQNKNQCVACNRPLEDNFISDPKLLPAAIDANESALWMYKTMRKLILEGKHFDAVLDMAPGNAAVLWHLTTFTVSAWHLLSLEQLQRLCSKLEMSIMHGLLSKPPNLWNKTVIEAAGNCDVSIIEWFTEWMEQRNVFKQGTFVDKLDPQLEASLLALCRTKDEFKALRRLLGGSRSDIIRGDVIDKYLDLNGKGQEWVMLAILNTGSVTDDDDKREKIAHRLLIKFPHPEMYQWAQKHRLVIVGCSNELALQYNVFPIVYGCHSKGLYAQSASLALKPVSFKEEHVGRALYTLLPDIHPDVKQRVLYVDLAHDTMKLDWHTVHDIKTLDATSKRVTVELCEDGVEIYLDFEQLLFPVNVPFKIVQFTELRLKQQHATKRKFLSIS